MTESRHCQSDMGKRLKKLRKDNHMTQQELADYLYVSVDSVSGYENGRITIAHDYIERLCLRFNVSADYFYFSQDRSLKEEGDSGVWSEFYSRLNEEERVRALEVLRLVFPKVLL